MKYILSIATVLILAGAGCASKPTPPLSEETPVVSPSAQIEQPTNTDTTTPPPTMQPTEQMVVPAVVATPSVAPTTPTSEPVQVPTVKQYTMTEITAANTESNCLTVINGTVYNLTAFINKHPGGDRNILRICGKDGTSAFNGQHGGEAKPEKMLATFSVGTLAQ